MNRAVAAFIRHNDRFSIGIAGLCSVIFLGQLLRAVLS